MKTKNHRHLALAALLTLAAATAAAAQDHGAMDHSKMNHGAAPTASAAEKPARLGVEIRTAAVSGYKLTYNLIDMKQLMQQSATPMTHGAEQMKSHHLMVYVAGPDGKPVTTGKAGYLVVQPDKVEAKAMAMFMQDGFGADVDLVVKGDYKITAKIALANTTLVDEFTYTVK